jgi:serine protease Do
MVRRRAAVVYHSPIDMVILKVHADHPLPAVKWGNSETMRPGDPVIAIGNPLGIGTTVTSGIVSALDRDIQETPYDAFIQTDASINHGNSGGPLFNLKGEVIGINTALYAPNGESGSVGLGFAIPGNDAQFILRQVKEYGRVRQGWLGALVQPVNDSIGDAIGLDPPRGVIIDSVVAGSPAAQAGLHAGDVIMKIGDEDMMDPRSYNRAVGRTPFGQVRPVTIWRDRMLQTLQIKFAESPNSQPPRMDMAQMAPVLKPLTVGDIGLTLAPVSPATRAKFKLDAHQQGVVVTSVTRNSIADNEGLVAGDVVVRAGGRPITSTDELRAAVKVQMAAKERHILMMLQDAHGVRFVGIPLVRLEEDAAR